MAFYDISETEHFQPLNSKYCYLMTNIIMTVLSYNFQKSKIYNNHTTLIHNTFAVILDIQWVAKLFQLVAKY